MERKDRAVSLFLEGFNCSQAVLWAFAGELGLEKETALRIAAGFGAGLGKTAETCGAVSGAVMVLGLKYGFAAADWEAKDRVYAVVREFLAAFRKDHGSLLCRDLLGCDLSTPEGFQQARESGKFRDFCPFLVAGAITLLEQRLKG